MTPKRKLIAFVILSAIVASFVLFGIGIVQFQVYGKFVVADSVLSHVETHSAMPTDNNLNVQWPWYYFLILNSIFSIYWFLLGRFAFKKFGQPLWWYSLLSPVVYFLLTFDFAFPLYTLATGIGGRSAFSKGFPVSPVTNG